MNKVAKDLEEIASYEPGLWQELRGERVFLTGGTGFFGCWLLESFCHVNRVFDLDARITVLTRDPEAFARKCPHLAFDAAVDLQRGDVRTFTYPSGQYRYVIHAATEASTKQATDAPLEMFSTIIAGTERTLDFATTHGAQKFLLTSSGAVYGKQPPDITHVPEAYGGAPNSADASSVYAEGKRAAELLCALYHNTHRLECKIARCWAFCGPYLPLDRHFAIGNFIGDVIAGRTIQIQGDGTPRRSYLYAADLMIWLWTILFRAPALTPINVGSARDVSILELAQLVAATLGAKAGIHVARQPVPGLPPLRYVPSVDRARELLGLCDMVGLEESIRRTAAWYRES